MSAGTKRMILLLRLRHQPSHRNKKSLNLLSTLPSKLRQQHNPSKKVEVDFSAALLGFWDMVVRIKHNHPPSKRLKIKRSNLHHKLQGSLLSSCHHPSIRCSKLLLLRMKMNKASRQSRKRASKIQIEMTTYPVLLVILVSLFNKQTPFLQQKSRRIVISQLSWQQVKTSLLAVSPRLTIQVSQRLTFQNRTQLPPSRSNPTTMQLKLKVRFLQCLAC